MMTYSSHREGTSMPVLSPRKWSRDPGELLSLGVRRMELFCFVNDLPVPKVYVVSTANWYFDACGFYRPDTPRTKFLMADREHGLASKGYGQGINVCLSKCQYPCAVEGGPRQQSWPASVTDRTPYGVVLHELGHHADWLTGDKKWEYGSEYCSIVKDFAREPGITSYADTNPSEWFAEAFRLFVGNPGLLESIRPRTYAELCVRFKPVGRMDWRHQLGSNVPGRIIEYMTKKGAK